MGFGRKQGTWAWHSRDNMMFELDAGLEKISCLDEISTWIFLLSLKDCA